MFSALTRFRMRRQTVNVTDGVYSLQATVPQVSNSGFKPARNKKSFKTRMLSGNGVSKNKPKCSHCEERNHEPKDCRVREYQLRQVQLM
ncbi:hypothetical protein V1517DRAFT_37519 [Lipomyces orientalis]|uniref:Uncharacterized protein n=1 Tax=Lipomyces orientalis TaxID=1233043 RepID=A0ACC3TER0_9ASCO